MSSKRKGNVLQFRVYIIHIHLYVNECNLIELEKKVISINVNPQVPSYREIPDSAYISVRLSRVFSLFVPRPGLDFELLKQYALLLRIMIFGGTN